MSRFNPDPVGCAMRTDSRQWCAWRTLLIAAVLLTGCAIPPSTAIKQPLSVRPEAVAVAPVNNGAIFQPAPSQARPGASLFEDRKARYVGDTLTVNLVEKTEAKRKSETTDERKANASLNIPAPTILGTTTGIGATAWAPASSSKQELKDNESNSNSFTGSITVTVVEVLPNGHLVVAGEKQVAINSDTEYIRLAGVVNPNQITSANSINSTQLANAQFESKNTQSMDVAQVGSMLARFFLTVLPF
ncbi:MAG: flagellar basal body L-ring protein FlgH [Pseudomonadota bacterium]|nr:flagellar basal body L-ring protein FlgH [Pseudomonadota bacterium]